MARAWIALRRVGSCFSPPKMTRICFAPLDDSVTTTAGEVMAAVKAGSALSVAVIAARYVARLAAVGLDR